MLSKFVNLVIGVALIVLMATSIHAKGDLSRQTPKEVVVKLDEFKFAPNKLEFETGKLYKLIIRNVGKVKHELDSSALSHLAYTRKIEVLDNKGGLLAELKGAPAEVEVGPGHEISWWFVPVATTEDEEFVCLIAGHYEAGMFGTMTFK